MMRLPTDQISDETSSASCSCNESTSVIGNEIHQMKSKVKYRDNLLRSPSKWFLRPPHLLRNGTISTLPKKQLKDEVSNESHKRKLSPYEEHFIRELCPVTLGHLLTNDNQTSDIQPIECYQDYTTDLLLKVDDYLHRDHLRLLTDEYNGRSNESITDFSYVPDEYNGRSNEDSTDLSYVPDELKTNQNNLNKGHRKKGQGRKVLIPTKVSYPNDDSMREFSTHARCFRSRSSSPSVSRQRLVSRPRVKSNSMKFEQNFNGVSQKAFLSGVKSLNNVSLPMISRNATSSVMTSAFQLETFLKKKEVLKMEEKEILNKIRCLELERLKPPVDKWYEMKDCRFHDESHRNTTFLKNARHLPQIQERRRQVRTALSRLN